MPKDYYFILGVEKNVSRDRIEVAYSERVGQFHPTACEPAKQAFIEIQEAYTFLHDPLFRAAYDRLLGSRSGNIPVKPVSSQGVTFPGKEINFPESFETFLPAYEELFDRFWSNFTSLTRPKAEKIESLNLEVILSPQEALSGGEVRVAIPGRIPCPSCRGKGGVGPYECWRCEGKGFMVREIPIQISYPPGISKHVAEVSLSPYGIHNFFLTVFFRVSETG
jgi:DnaJ-class molecular chaperone